MKRLVVMMIVLAALSSACANGQATAPNPAVQQARAKLQQIWNPQGSDPVWLQNVKRSNTTFDAKKLAYNEISNFVNGDLSKLGNEPEAGVLKNEAFVLRHGRANNYVRALFEKARSKYRDLQDVEEALKIMKEANVNLVEVVETGDSIRSLVVQKVEEKFNGERGLLVEFNGPDSEPAMSSAKRLLNAYNFTPGELERIGLTVARAENPAMDARHEEAVTDAAASGPSSILTGLGPARQNIVRKKRPLENLRWFSDLS